MAALVVSTDAGNFAIQEHEYASREQTFAGSLLKRRRCCSGSNPAIRPGWLRPEPRTAIGNFTPISATKQPRYKLR